MAGSSLDAGVRKKITGAEAVRGDVDPAAVKEIMSDARISVNDRVKLVEASDFNPIVIEAFWEPAVSKSISSSPRVQFIPTEIFKRMAAASPEVVDVVLSLAGDTIDAEKIEYLLNLAGVMADGDSAKAEQDMAIRIIKSGLEFENSRAVIAVVKDNETALCFVANRNNELGKSKDVDRLVAEYLGLQPERMADLAGAAA